MNYRNTNIYRSARVSETIFGHPHHLVNEGSFYRLAELNIINKGNIDSCVIDDKKALIKYTNGEVITLGIA